MGLWLEEKKYLTTSRSIKVFNISSINYLICYERIQWKLSKSLSCLFALKKNDKFNVHIII